MTLLNSVADVLLAKEGILFSKDQIKRSCAEYLGMEFDASYVAHFNAGEIATHVYGYMCAIAAEHAGKPFSYGLQREKDAFYFCGASQTCQVSTQGALETFLAEKEAMKSDHSISIRSYHSSSTASKMLILYTVEFTPFIDPTGKSSNFEQLTTKKFLQLRSGETRERYEKILQKLHGSIAPVYTINKLPNGLLALKMAFIPDRISYLTALSTLINTIPGVQVAKKFGETFSNGAQVYTYYVRNATAGQLEEAACLIGMLPHVPGRITTQLYNQQLLNAKEVIYCHAITMFAFYFTPPQQSEDFSELSREVRLKPTSVTRLKKLRSEMFQQIITEPFIGTVIRAHIGIVKALYDDFKKGPTPDSCSKLEVLIQQQLRHVSHIERQVVNAFLTFNRAVVKTNFFKVHKAAVAFRLDPSFIGHLDYPRVPYGIFIILGSQFRGFHIRFTDIARGGVRMIVSNNHTYDRNKLSLFAENYNLALAQHMKNKDIPEGGSKGTILVSTRATLDRTTLFLQYVDALLDLMLPNTPGVRDTLSKPEILFLGPDENTAGTFPSIAALHAKGRGYKQWKSFTTGKGQDIGGIPHDTYGMTSQGVRTYVNCIYNKLNLDPSNLTKFQTGGPDGDLGSNEILLGNEKSIGLVDGSGSIYDPEGLDKEELLRLANNRLTVKHFDAKKLSSRGFFVGVEARNVTLPDGNLVEDGERFRNTFHFSRYCVADTFVPCGGRPASVNLDNVHKLLINVPGVTGQAMIEGKVGNLAGTDKLRFKYIVEGANLFITHDARIALETVGVQLVKDSSANKGGVSCSSLEVLSGLAFTDAEHQQHMCVVDPKNPPEFYTSFVNDIIQRLQDNAKREFDALWVEKLRTDGKNTLISDALSSKIVAIRQFIMDSDLYNDAKLKNYVLRQYIPTVLFTKLPLSQVLVRVPETYLRSMFAIWIASDFVYTTGLGANEFSFFMYMHKLSQKADGNGSKL